MAVAARFKPAPLLAPPQESDWMNMTEKDQEIMISGLDKARKSYISADLIMLHYFLKELGMPQTITKQDKEIFSIHMELAKKEKGRDNIGWSHHLLKEIGCPQQITDADKIGMAYKLAREKTGANGWEMAEALHHITELGLYDEILRIESGCRITEKDQEEFTQQLSAYTSIQEGWGVARMHYLIRKTGKPTTITKDELALIKNEMQDARTRNDGVRLAEIHFLLKELQPTKDGGNTTEMPPLKKLG